MICNKCNQEISDNALFCKKCGNALTKFFEQETSDTTSISENVVIKKKTNVKKIIIPIVIVFSVCLLLISGLIIYNEVGKAKLREEIKGTWYKREYDSGISYNLELRILNKTIMYYFKSEALDSFISGYDYEVVAPNKIKIEFRSKEYEVDICNGVMTISPSFIDTESRNTWHKK